MPKWSYATSRARALPKIEKMAAKENEVDWKSALSIKRALVKRNLSTKTPNLKGDARLQALQTRLRTFLSSQAHVNNINDKAAKNRPLSASSIASNVDSVYSNGQTPRVGMFTPRDVEQLNTVASLKKALDEVGLSTRTPGLKGKSRVDALKQRLLTGDDGGLTSRSEGLTSSRSEGNKTWRESTSASSGSNSSRGSFRTSTKKTSRKQFNEADIEEMRQKLAEMEDMIQPPKDSPPQSPKPPSYAPPATDDSSSAIYWSGWNNTDSTKVKSEGERDDDNEDSNIDMYEKAYRANDTEGIDASNSVNEHSQKNCL